MPAEFKKFLLYARQMEIRVGSDAPTTTIISFTVPHIGQRHVLDYDAREQRVYWSDADPGHQAGLHQRYPVWRQSSLQVLSAPTPWLPVLLSLLRILSLSVSIPGS